MNDSASRGLLPSPKLPSPAKETSGSGPRRKAGAAVSGPTSGDVGPNTPEAHLADLARAAKALGMTVREFRDLYYELD